VLPLPAESSWCRGHAVARDPWRTTSGKCLGGAQHIRLNQKTLEIQAGQQLLHDSPLARFTGVVGLLGQSDAKATGVDDDLRDKAVTAIPGLDDGAAQGLANRSAEAQGLRRPADPNPAPRQGSG
jgi:hypothetical protein